MPINAKNTIFYINFLILKAVITSGKIIQPCKNMKDSKVENLGRKEADYFILATKKCSHPIILFETTE